ncbi:hypothetical protein Dimus_039126 [Dionaea muscipula]
MPMAVLDWKSPYEVLHGHPPSYGHLCIFLDACVMQPRLGFRETSLILVHTGVGLSVILLNTRGTSFSLDSHKIICNRDVYFYENIFPVKKGLLSSPSEGITPRPVAALGDMDDLGQTVAILPSQPVDDLQTSVVSPVPSDSDDSDHLSSPSSPTGNIASTPAPLLVALRQSNRAISKPGCLVDYVSSVQVHSVEPHAPFTSCVSMDNVYPFFNMHVGIVPLAHAAFLESLCTEHEPEEFQQAQAVGKATG